MNRQLTGRIATYNFAPTNLSKINLLRENIHEESVFVTGNSVIDALYWVLNKIDTMPDIEQGILATLDSFGLPTALVNSWATYSRQATLNDTSGTSRKLPSGGFCLSHEPILPRTHRLRHPHHPNPIPPLSLTTILLTTQFFLLSTFHSSRSTTPKSPDPKETAKPAHESSRHWVRLLNSIKSSPTSTLKRTLFNK